MNKKDLATLKKWFTDYVAAFYTDDPEYNRSIKLKEEHTKRVCSNILMLGNVLNMSEYDMMLAETMAMFHDIGRFKQYAVYGTFSDKASENHARLGLRQMAVNKVLSVCTTEEKRIITKAIAYHNALSLPLGEDERRLFFMRLLRDADKLDIWKVVLDYYHTKGEPRNKALELGLPDEPGYSQKILQALHEHRIALIRDLKTLNDFKLLQIGWVFDLNFTPSFQAVQRQKYIQEIAATLPQSEDIAAAVKEAEAYVRLKAEG